MLVGVVATALPGGRYHHHRGHPLSNDIFEDLERAVVDVLHHELERPASPGSGVAKMPSVPAEAFIDPTTKNLRVPEVLVRTQHADCPDAQCPRAKMENIGYFAKGYNLLFGNPMSELPGVDPGFINHGGGYIWKLAYDHGLETTDGRFQVPDNTAVEHNVGCSLSMHTSAHTDERKVADSLSVMAKVSGEAHGGMAGFAKVEGSFQASGEYRGYVESNAKTETTEISTSADCVVYHGRIPLYSDKPKFSFNFLKGVRVLIDAAVASSTSVATNGTALERALGGDGLIEMRSTEDSKYEAFHLFFSEFGTHWQEYVQMGARYGLNQLIEETVLEDLEKSGVKIDVAAEISVNKQGDDCPGTPCGFADKDSLADKDFERAGAADWDANLERQVSLGKMRRVRRAKVTTRPSTDPRSFVTDFAGWEHVYVPVVEEAEAPSEAETKPASPEAETKPASKSHQKGGRKHGKSTVESMVSTANLERAFGGGAVAGSASVSSMSEGASKLSDKVDKTTVVSIGAKPKGDVMEWAEQTEDENMPINFQLGPICELVALAAERDFLTEDKVFCDAGESCGRCLSELQAEQCPSAEELAKLKPCHIVRPGAMCVANEETASCGTRAIGQCSQEATKVTVYQSVVAKDQLHQASIDSDAAGIFTMVDKATRQLVTEQCVKALESYCPYVKKKYGYPTMTCKIPLGGLNKPRSQPECTRDNHCSKKAPMDKCIENRCTMKYNKVVDVVMMGSDWTTVDNGMGRTSNECAKLDQTMGGTWNAVRVEGRSANYNTLMFKDQMRSHCSRTATRLCVQTEDAPIGVGRKGVCRLMITYGETCKAVDGINWQDVTTGGTADGNFRQKMLGPMMRLCVTYDGCEGREEDGVTRAITQLGALARGGSLCPSFMPGARRLWTSGGNGVFDGNVNMNAAQYNMCQEKFVLHGKSGPIKNSMNYVSAGTSGGQDQVYICQTN